MKRIINTDTQRTTWRGERYVVDGAPGVVDDPDLVLATEVRHDPPTHDPATQRLVRIEDGIENGDEWHMGRFEVVDLSAEEIAERAEQERRAIEAETPPAVRLLLEKTLPVATLKRTEAAALAGVMRQYETGLIVTVNQLLSRGRDEVWRMESGHTTAAHWPLESSPSLYTLLAKKDPETGLSIWTQPKGSTDAFRLGEVVIHPGTRRVYISRNDANVWEPGEVAANIWEPFTP